MDVGVVPSVVDPHSELPQCLPPSVSTMLFHKVTLYILKQMLKANFFHVKNSQIMAFDEIFELKTMIFYNQSVESLLDIVP